MKKTKLVLSVALGAMMLSTGALSTFAATEKTAGTDGKVNFETQGPLEPGDITKPDTPEEIIEIPGGGNSTVGPLRLNFVPHFDFGTMKVSSNTITGNALFLDYNKKDETATAKIAHFAQVEDVRGLESGDWTLTVKADTFKGKKDGKDYELAASAIELPEGKMYNTRMNSTELGNAVTMYQGKTATLEAPIVIPNNGTPIELMSTKTGQGTNSSKTSLVFNNKYSAQEPVGEETGATNPGVTLRSVGSDNKLADVNYKSTLTWTLSSTL